MKINNEAIRFQETALGQPDNIEVKIAPAGPLVSRNSVSTQKNALYGYVPQYPASKD